MGKVHISESPINAWGEITSLLQSSRRIGALVTFMGVIREISEGKEVEKLFYDYYPEMASDALNRIRDEAISRFGLIDATIIHRVGETEIGDLVLLVIVASEHRSEAFKAVEWIVDEVKREAAIWKKEYFKDGEYRWVEPERSDLGEKLE